MLNRYSGVISTECLCGSLVDSVLCGGWISTRKALYFLDWKYAWCVPKLARSTLEWETPLGSCDSSPLHTTLGRYLVTVCTLRRIVLSYGRILHRLTGRESLGIVIRVSMGGRKNFDWTSFRSWSFKGNVDYFVGRHVTGWIREKDEKIRPGIGTWTRADRTTVERL